MRHERAPSDPYSFADARLGGAVILLVTAAVLLAIGSLVFDPGDLDADHVGRAPQPAWQRRRQR